MGIVLFEYGRLIHQLAKVTTVEQENDERYLPTKQFHLKSFPMNNS